jgi:outer membrane autotransporter protein
VNRIFIKLRRVLMSINFKNKLLLTTAITTAAFTAGSVKAADINILGPSVAAQVVGADNENITVTGSGNLTVTGAAAFDAVNFDNIGVLVDTTNTSNGISSDGLALDFTDASSSINYITVNSGRITSSGATTVSIAGLADSYTITTLTNGTISNSSTNGTTFAITGAAGTANQVVTVDNAGSITSTGATSNVFTLADTNGGSSITVTNSGSITAASGGDAFDIATSGNNGTGNDLSITQTAGGSINGVIRGAVSAADGIIVNNTDGTVGDIVGTAGTVSVTNTDTGAAPTASVGNITVTTGGITIVNNTGSGTIGDVAANGAGGTVTITNNAGTIGNLDTGTGALLVSANTGTLGNINGGGNVTVTSTGGDIGNIQNGGSGTLTANLTDTNAGTITGSGSGTAAVTLSGASTTGAIDLGTNASSSLTLNDTSEVNAAVTMGAVNQTLTFNGGTINGDIIAATNGSGDIQVDVSTVTNGNIGTNSNQIDDVNIADGATFNLDTSNDDLYADKVILSGATGTLTVGTGAMNFDVDGAGNGQGIFNLNETNNLGGTVGSNAYLAAVNLATGADITNTGNFTVDTEDFTLNGTSTFNAGTAAVTVRDDLTIGSGTFTTGAGALAVTDAIVVGTNGDLVVGAGGMTAGSTALGSGSSITLGGTFTGDINGNGDDGFGAVIIAANQALGGNIGNTFDVASVTINNGVDVTNAADRSITTTGNLTLNGNSTLNVDDGAVTVGGDLNMGNGSMTTGTGLLSVADAIVLDGTTLNIGSGGVSYATINGFNATEGTLNFTAGTHNTTGEIGDNFGLSTINVNDGVTLTIDENVTATKIEVSPNITNGSGTLNISAGLTTADIDLEGTSTLTLSGTGSFDGTIDGDGAGEGNVVVDRNFATTADTIFGGANGLNQITVNTTRTLTLDGANAGGDLKADDVVVNGTLAMGNAVTALTGNLTVNSTGAINLGNSNHTASGTFDTSAGSQISSTISAVTSGTTFTAGRLTGVGTSSINAGTIVNLTLASNAGYINDGASFTLVDAGAGVAPDLTTDSTQIRVNGATGANSNRTGVLTFDSTLSGANDLIIKVERTAYADVATNTQADAVGAALNTIGATATGALSQLQTAADNATTAGALNDVLDSATAQVDGGITESSIGATNIALNTFEGRLSDVRSGFGSGVSSGDDEALNGVWVRAFGNTATFDNDGGLKGYDANTAGIAVGADTALDDTTILGVGLTYANSTIESNNTNKDTDAASYNLMVYGSKELGSNNYVDGFVSAGMNNYETSRFIPTTGATAQGDFDGTTYMARVSGGHRIDAGNGIEIVPNAGVTYGFSQSDSYTETGAGTLNLNVDNDDITVLQPKIGVDVAFNGGDADGIKFRPQVRIGYMYDALDSTQETTSNFSGVATSFKTESAEKDKGTFLIGTGVDIAGTENITLSADYDYQVSSGYNSHNGMLNLRYGF